MGNMNRWPWITLALALALAINPFGQDLIHSAFFSGEQLARTLSQLVLYCGLGGLAGLVLIESGIRYYIHRRRAGRPARRAGHFKTER
jgi:hypothetical protein